MKTFEGRRDMYLSHAYSLARFKDRLKTLPQIREFVRRANKAAPLTERQVNNLIVELGFNTTMKILGREF